MISYPWLGTYGRLGNQCWQVASTIGIARARGEEPGFPANWSYRPYFSLPESFYLEKPELWTPSTRYATHLNEQTRMYLQDLSFWRDIAQEIAEIFTPSDLAEHHLRARPEYEGLEKSIAIHVRRGDYVVSQDAYWLPTISYYAKALAILPPEVPVIVFSDGIGWCRDQLPVILYDRPVTYFEGVPRPKEQEPEYKTAPVMDWIDLMFMARCRYHIISNSTYSWWGAWLSKNPAPIYPTRWYGPSITYADPTLMMPGEWISVMP